METKSIKIKNGRDLINSEEYVREPVDKKINEILSSNKRRIILAGNRGTGKSTVLYAMQNRGLGTKEQTIIMTPDPLTFMTKEPSEKFNEELFDYIYGAIFVNNILCYVKNNYPLAFEKYFKKDKELLSKLLHEFDEQLNNCWYDDTVFTTSKAASEILYRTVEKIYDKLNVKKLNIAIDRFDEINSSSEYVQKLYEKYFDLFDQTIIAIKDPHIDKIKLSTSGYDIQKITYGKNKDVLREIIKRRIANDDGKQQLYTQDIFINKLTKKGDNINFSLNVLRYVDRILDWDGKSDNIEELIDKAAKYQKDEDKKLQKIIRKSTLYI